MSIIARRRARGVVAVACTVLLPVPVALMRPAAAAEAPTVLAAGTVVFTTPGADSVSTLAGGSPAEPLGSGLTSPRGLAVGADGSVYVADTGANRLVRIGPDGTQTTIADGLSAPNGVASAGIDTVLVADSGHGRIVQVSADGVQEVASGFLAPVAVALARSGDLIVGDAAANSVVVIAPDGTRTPVGDGWADPLGVAVDPTGAVIVADTGNNRVVAVDVTGTQRDLGSGFDAPTAVAVGGDGTVFVADTGNHRIVQLAPDGTQSDLAEADAVALASYVAPQVITFTSAVPGAATVGGIYLATAVGGTGSGEPVTFSADPDSAGCTVDADGTVEFVHVGTCIVDADQQGTVDYAAAPRVQQTIDVDRGAQVVEFTSSAPVDARVGQMYLVAATGGGSGQPIVFSAGPSSTGCTVDPDGTVTFVHVGNCDVTADQAGDDDWEPATSAHAQLPIGRGSQLITFSSGTPDAAVVGGGYVPAAVGGGSGLPVTISVDPSANTCTVGTDATVSFVHAGTCTVLADQAGDDDWESAEQAQQVVTVGRRPAGLVFDSSPPDHPVVGQTYVALVTSSTGDPVVFEAGAGSTGCTVAQDGTVDLVAVGTCVVDATQPATDDTDPATTQQSFDIDRGSQVITFLTTAPAHAGVGSTYLVAATGGASGQPVVFSADPQGAACTVSADGTVQFTAVGTCIVDADQDGTADYEHATRATQTIAVSKGTQTITFTSTPPATAMVGGMYSAKAVGGASGRPVLFAAAVATVDNCAVITTGIVRFTRAGLCTVVASQAGSPKYLKAPPARQVIRAWVRQQITFTSTPDWPQAVGSRYAVSATGGGSGLPVRFSVSADSAGVCRMNGSSRVLYLAAGTCTVVAVQPGTLTYASAGAQQVVSVVGRGGGGVSPIRHVVLIFQENHTFDETLGTYCATRPTPCDGYVGPVRLQDGTVVPMTHSPDIVPSVEHGSRGQLRAINNGAMDGWASLHGCAAPTYSCLTYYDRADIPNLAALADRFVVSDRTFSMSNSPSWGGHLYAATATVDGFTGDNPQADPNVQPGPGWGCDSYRLADWAPSNGAATIKVPACVPNADGSGPYRPSPVSHVSSIFNELDTAHLPWKIYGTTRADASMVGGGGYGWSICPSLADCLYTQQVNNLVRSQQVLTDAANGDLPAYSVVTPSASSSQVVGTATSQHNNTSMLAGDNWIGQVVSAIENGPDWNSTAIFITYDDCGCFYDHVPPPANPDGTRQGIRLPMVIVSPYSKSGFTDSQAASLTSVLAFTERTFHLPALSPNDASAYDYGQSFRFDQAPRAGAVLHQRPVPTSSIAWARAHPDGDDET